MLQPAVQLSLLSEMLWLCMKLWSVDVQITVTSQVSGFPRAHGTKVRPSGRIQSERDRPFGCLVIGVPVVGKILAMMSLRPWWRAIRPAALLHTRSWVPVAPTCAPQRQVCGTSGVPSGGVSGPWPPPPLGELIFVFTFT